MRLPNPIPVAGLALALACSGPEYLEPEQGGREYALQGEYQNESLGAQVVAQGNGRFEAALQAGGLPGAGARPGPAARASGRDDGDTVTFVGDFDGALRDGTLRVQPVGAEPAVLRRIERVSPTLGAAPPPGATVLFGGPDLSAFAKASLDPRGFLAAGARTRQSFGSFSLHVEFRTPFMPAARGQGRGNSGVYLQERYEIQVLDSFGLPTLEDGCGAIYAQRAPDLNMSFPPLAWQTYDIDFTAARFDASGARSAPATVTVRQNGVVIHDRVALSGPTGRGEAEGPEPGPLLFQDHWDPVVYRNLWLVPR
jgi:3-keto-disaccharide hydrolase